MDSLVSASDALEWFPRKLTKRKRATGVRPVSVPSSRDRDSARNSSLVVSGRESRSLSHRHRISTTPKYQTRHHSTKRTGPPRRPGQSPGGTKARRTAAIEASRYLMISSEVSQLLRTAPILFESIEGGKYESRRRASSAFAASGRVNEEYTSFWYAS